ncbi:uncharacterized protein LOC144983691 [Oryzias latipes]
MLSEYIDPPLNLGMSPGAPAHSCPPQGPALSHSHELDEIKVIPCSDGRMAEHNTASQQPVVRPKQLYDTTRYTSPHSQLLGFESQPHRHPLGQDPESWLSLQPPVLSPYYTTPAPPAQVSIPQPVVPPRDIRHPMPQQAPTVPELPIHPQAVSHLSPPLTPRQQGYMGYSQSCTVPYAPAPNHHHPPADVTTNGTPPTGCVSQMPTLPSPIFYSQGPSTTALPPTMGALESSLTLSTPINLKTTSHNHTATAFHPQHTMPSKLPPQVAPPSHSTNPLLASYAPNPLLRNSGTTPNPSTAQMTYGGFMQTHQVRNVQVFTGHTDSKMLVDDWIRDMQYLLDAIELPAHLRFSTVVRHLSGEARKLVLNLPSSEQTPEKAFEELRAEYGDAQGSLDPLADFYERTQRPGESACSYAIALESILRSVEESQRRSRPFPDRDSKLTRQFLRGLCDEEVFARIAPMKPRLLSFRELQVELRDLARESKKFHSQPKSKKPGAQVQFAAEYSTNVKAERAKPSSELSALTELVQKLAINQEEHMAKLSRLEARIAVPPLSLPSWPQSPPAPSPRPRPPAPPYSTPPMTNTEKNQSFVCYRCGKQGHIARVCKAAFPSPCPNPTWAQQPQPSTLAEEAAMPPSQALNS